MRCVDGWLLAVDITSQNPCSESAASNWCFERGFVASAIPFWLTSLLSPPLLLLLLLLHVRTERSLLLQRQEVVGVQTRPHGAPAPSPQYLLGAAAG
jgi:hypothetical protein